ncbi:MAG: hypothetical protein FJ406_12495, partial [Verrucomicrobia bacterium]|nr:hypothetical protein [Verrucomicrobiota bacterium]
MRPAVLLPLLASVATMGSTPASAAPGENLVKPLEVRTVFTNGKHNAFTALRRFQGDLWLAFRAG